MSIQDGRCSGSSLALAERIQEKLERIVREKKTTAACAAVCGPEGLLAAACAGTRGFDDSPARVDDLYNVGSVSKIYVTAAVMKLVQEGRISLDEPVRRYLPDWRMADERCGEITVRMLLNHSSGIPGTNLHDHLDLEEEEELYTGKYRNTPAYWQTVKLRARPGSFSSYGNDGFDLVAEVVEAVTGKPYIRWLREQITGPAGAFSAGVGRRLAEGHVKVACRGDEPEYYNCFGAGQSIPQCRSAPCSAPSSSIPGASSDRHIWTRPGAPRERPSCRGHTMRQITAWDGTPSTTGNGFPWGKGR